MTSALPPLHPQAAVNPFLFAALSHDSQEVTSLKGIDSSAVLRRKDNSEALAWVLLPGRHSSSFSAGKAKCHGLPQGGKMFPRLLLLTRSMPERQRFMPPSPSSSQGNHRNRPGGTQEGSPNGPAHQGTSFCQHPEHCRHEAIPMGHYFMLLKTLVLNLVMAALRGYSHGD